MTNSPLILPMFCHVLLTGLLYVLLTVMRAPSVWKIGANKDGTNPLSNIEKRTSANLSNQFEWPLFFYIVCVILLTNSQLYNMTYLWLAWVFVTGRILHSFVQIFTSNLKLRGIVFTVNFLAVIGMWMNLFLSPL